MIAYIITIGLFGLAQVIIGMTWGLRLEARVSVIDQKHLDLRELINFRFDETDRRLERIEKAFNGSLKH